LEYIVALTGASGAAYGLRLVEELLKRGDVHAIISPNGFLLLKEELSLDISDKNAVRGIIEYLKKRGSSMKGRLFYTPSDSMAAPLASGSSLKRAMVICPCSMGTLARVACGVSTTLIERAADCVLKEGGKLVLVPRETPLNALHLENMLKLARTGATILPAMPAFYHGPKSIEDMVDFVVGKVLDNLGIENELYKRWKGQG
jgi:4-hydroxy-3-polyprenylbenzoate decarboxylase